MQATEINNYPCDIVINRLITLHEPHIGISETSLPVPEK